MLIPYRFTAAPSLTGDGFLLIDARFERHILDSQHVSGLGFDLTRLGIEEFVIDPATALAARQRQHLVAKQLAVRVRHVEQIFANQGGGGMGRLTC